MTKNIIITAIVALVVSLIVGFIFVKSNQSFGSLSERLIRTVSLQIGNDGVTQGTRFTFVKTGTCSLLAHSSIPATTTRSVDCAITGIRSGDLVDLNLAASTTLASQYVIKSSQASTTNGWATVQLLNLTGGTAVPANTNGFGSSTVYKLYRASN